MLSNDLRALFLDFFYKNNHQKVPSSSLIPHNDPSLLFTNAGMNQFKDFFLDPSQASYSRATSVQKCIRAGGKHNDLENVGFTPRHHTFFEMLGNFSFGDYFKEEAIYHAWNFLTKELSIPKEKFLISVYFKDTQSLDLWKKIGVHPSKIFQRDEKDNFWEMGSTGPCGPCSEIFFDHGEQYSSGVFSNPLDDESRFVEIWNLVFMEYERIASGDLVLLQKKSVDTGCGLERLTSVVQNVYSNYDTDLFLPLKNILKKSSKNSTDSSLNVVVDHLRSSCFLLAEGIIPGPESRNYVLRRILRRAIRHLDILGIHKPFLHLLVEPLFDGLGSTYNEERKKISFIQDQLQEEESKFRKTLTQGLSHFELLKKSEITGEKVFQLYDTYGIPQDLIEVLFKENFLAFPHEEFHEELEKQKIQSRKHQKFQQKESEEHLHQFQDTKRSLLTTHTLQSEILYQNKEKILLSETCFFPTMGGQSGDHGTIFDGVHTVNVIDVIKQDNHIFHIIDQDILLQKKVSLSIDTYFRKEISKHHSATHLLLEALRFFLGSSVEQKGSYLNHNRLRLDFTYPKPLSKSLLNDIEKFLQEKITANIPVSIFSMKKEDALKSNILAFFGEKYPNIVRVVQIGTSVELCGGTHVDNSSEIGGFSLQSETSVSSGVRRIEACVGNAFIHYSLAKKEELALLYSLSKGETPLNRLIFLEKSLQEKESWIKEIERKNFYQKIAAQKNCVEILDKEFELIQKSSSKMFFYSSSGKFFMSGDSLFLEESKEFFKSLSIKCGGQGFISGVFLSNQKEALFHYLQSHEFLT
jgi:alanyl-tRNA synthetase